MEKFKCLVFGILLTITISDGAKILAVFPIPSPSHGILGDNMIKHLLNAGHEVTYVTPFADKQPNSTKLRLVDVSDNKKFFRKIMIDVKQIMDGVIDLKDADFTFQSRMHIGELTLSNQNVQNLLKDRTNTFDVIIGEYMFTDLYSSLPAVFQCPLIWFSSIEPHWKILNLVHGPLNPSYNSDFLQDQVAPYSFARRVKEFWIMIRGLYKHNGAYYAKEEEVYLKHIAPIVKEQGRPVPNYNELKYNASLLMGNSQVAIGSAVPLPPSYKHIGGYHIDDPVKPLPEDLKKIMDSAKNVIYFSLGSNLKSKDLPDDLKQGLLKVFGGLNQTVLWKFEENLPNIPKNVHIVQWAPQQSILAHPNLVLFVTHGGLLSITEAIHFATPVITIPVFADQFLNADRAQQKGYAVKVDLSYRLHEDLKVALDKVLGDLPKYAARVKELSIAYHDSPLKPKDALNFWVNHVIKTKGAPHLRSIALQIPLYQRVYLDLLAVGLVALVILLLVVKRICFNLVTCKQECEEVLSDIYYWCNTGNKKDI